MRYVDGLGRAAQSKTSAGASGWLSSGMAVYDSRGFVREQFEPFHAGDAAFGPEARGVSATASYDALGRVVRVDHPDGTHERTSFEAWRTEAWDRNDTDPSSPHAGTPAVTGLDARGLEVRVVETNVAGEPDRTTVFEYDALGQTRSVVDPRGLTAFRYRYDLLGRVTHTESVDAGAETTLWNTNGDVLRTWNARELVTTRGYDAEGRLARVHVAGGDGEEALNHVVQRIEYGDTDGGGPELALRNARGRPVRVADEAGVVEIGDYGLDGQVRSESRRLRVAWKSAADWSGSTVADSDETLEDVSYESGARFDALGRLVVRRCADGTTRRFTYDALGRLDAVRVSSDDGLLDDVEVVGGAEYNARNQLTALAYGNGTRLDRAYDPATFRLASLNVTGPNRPWFALSYGYDGAGNILRVDDAVQEPSGPTQGIVQGASVSAVRAFRYDAFYQLVEATGRAHQALLADDYRDAAAKGTRHLSLNNGAALERYTRSYQYDLAGNMTRMRHGGVTREWVRSFDVSAGSNRRVPTPEPGEALGPGFDAAGNMRTFPHLRSVRWDYANRLSRAVIIDRGESDGAGVDDAEFYAYDGNDQRVRRVTQRMVDASTGAVERVETVYLDGCELRRVVHEDPETGAETLLVRKTSHIRFGEQRAALVHRWEVDTLARETTSLDVARVHYQVGDHLGSATLELDETGALISYEAYFPFGGTAFVARRSARDVKLKEYRYSGKLRDDATGLYYYGYRYYAPWIGGWLSPDPVGPADGLNLYRFVWNNPVRFVDADGLESDSPPDDKAISLGSMYIHADKPKGPQPETIDHSGAQSSAEATSGGTWKPPEQSVEPDPPPPDGGHTGVDGQPNGSLDPSPQTLDPALAERETPKRTPQDVRAPDPYSFPRAVDLSLEQLAAKLVFTGLVPDELLEFDATGQHPKRASSSEGFTAAPDKSYEEKARELFLGPLEYGVLEASAELETQYKSVALEDIEYWKLFWDATEALDVRLNPVRRFFDALLDARLQLERGNGAAAVRSLHSASGEAIGLWLLSRPVGEYPRSAEARSTAPGGGPQAGGLDLTVPGDEFGKYASRATPKPGYTDVAIHGAPHYVTPAPGGAGAKLSHRDVARQLEHSADYAGGPVRLISCNTGACGASVGQNLANKLGVDVMAPDNIVWAFSNGKLVVAPRLIINGKPSRWPDLSKIGSWKIFSPGTKP